MKMFLKFISNLIFIWYNNLTICSNEVYSWLIIISIAMMGLGHRLVYPDYF